MKRTFLHFAENLKKPLYILTAFAVSICTAFAFPNISFADSVFDNQPFQPLENANPTAAQVRALGYQWRTESTYYCFAPYPYECYTFRVGNYAYFVVPDEVMGDNNSFTIYLTYAQNDNSVGANSRLSINYETNLQFTYRNALDGQPLFPDNFPSFSTAQEGFTAIRDYIDNGSSGESSDWVNKPLVIPQGYTAVINTTNMTTGKGGFRLRANTGNLGNSNLWRDIFGNDNVQSGQAVYNTNTPITSYDFDDYPQLTWSPYEYSLLRATAYEYIGEATKANTYTYIFNPIQGNATSIKNGQNTNSYITLYMNDQFDGTVKLYPLTSMAAVGQGQTIDIGNDESENAGSGDISNGTWTNSDGNVFTPPQGGGNGTGSSQNPLEAIAGTVEHLGEVLNQFVGGLSTILTAPVEAIQTLINNGSAFVSHLSGLYSWLPTQVYSTLTSAIILCITVGVLKVLL